MMMNEFGTPMSDAELNMLPPGSCKPHERLIAESGLEQNWWQVVGAIAGTALSYFGARKSEKANKKAMEDRYQYDLKVDEFNWQEAEDQYKFNVETVDLASYNMDRERKWKQKAAIDAWNDKEKMRLFDQNNQIKSYNESVRAAKRQLDNVEVAVELASNSAKRSYQDDLNALAFKYEDIGLQTGAQTKEGERKRTDISLKATQQGIQTKYQKKTLLNNISFARKKLHQDLEQSNIKSLLKQDQFRNLGQTGRTANRNIASILAETGRNENRLIEAYFNAQGTAGLDIDKLNELTNNTKDQLLLQDEMVTDQILNISKQDEFQKRQLHEQLKSTNLQRDWDIEKLKMDEYQQKLDAQKMIKARPVEPPKLSKPHKLPVPKLQKPRPPRRGIKPIKGVVAGTGAGLAALGSGITALSGLMSGGGGTGGP